MKKRLFREAEYNWMDKRTVYCHNERGREVNRHGRVDRCVEHIFTSVNSRVIALIAAVNNSKPLVRNSLWEEPECDNLTLTYTQQGTLTTVFDFLSPSVYCYF